MFSLSLPFLSAGLHDTESSAAGSVDTIPRSADSGAGSRRGSSTAAGVLHCRLHFPRGDQASVLLVPPPPPTIEQDQQCQQRRQETQPSVGVRRPRSAGHAALLEGATAPGVAIGGLASSSSSLEYGHLGPSSTGRTVPIAPSFVGADGLKLSVRTGLVSAR